MIIVFPTFILERPKTKQKDFDKIKLLPTRPELARYFVLPAHMVQYRVSFYETKSRKPQRGEIFIAEGEALG